MEVDYLATIQYQNEGLSFRVRAPVNFETTNCKNAYVREDLYNSRPEYVLS